MTDKFVGRAFCLVKKDNKQYSKGMRSAYVNIVCSANSLPKAAKLIFQELSEIELEVAGFDFLFDEKFLDRTLSKYEQSLLQKVDQYPVQFENVHFFPPNA